MTDDAELLRRYADDRSEEAFAELVRRHLGMVYHAALRRCGGDAHRAEDVAQAVFRDLARKAASLARRPALAGWLHRSTRYAAAQAVRTEARRQAREREAHAMTGGEGRAGPPVDWEQLRPVIDEALDRLGDRDRAAVVLRFFEGRSWAEIGRHLALTEDAARMRVDRALDKMRGVLARHGVTSTAAALGAALAVPAAAEVPAGLAASVTGAALAGGAAGSAAFLLTMTKLQIGGALALAAAGAAALVWQHQTNTRLRAELAEVPALRADNARLRVENQKLARVAAAPGNAPPPASASPGAPAAVTGAGAARPKLAAGLVPLESLGNGGRATPRAAFATQLWAARAGDTAVEASTILLEPEGRAKLEGLMAALPAAVREQYEPPEKLMALALADNPHPVGGMRVLGETALDADDVLLQTEWQHADDTIVHHAEVRMHRDDGGWKLVVPEILVDRAAAFLARRAGPPGGQ